MKKKILSGIMTVLQLIGMFTLTFHIHQTESTSSSIFFLDDFEDTSLNATRWVAEPNEGTIEVVNSSVNLTSEGRTFPHVYSKTNPFPTTGGFLLEFDLTYLQVTGDGDGFYVSQGIFEPPSFANVLEVWQDNLDYGQYRYLRIHLLGNPIFSSSNIDTTRHKYALEYLNGTFAFYMDGEKLSSASSSLRPDMIGFGHPPPYPVTWTSFKIDRIIVYIRPFRTVVVPDDYSTIQEAINNANEGDTIFVRNGTYYENVVVNKTVSLVGENTRTTIIDGNNTGTVMNITANNVNITSFTIQKSGAVYPNCGIYISSSGNNMSHNIITNNQYGICLSYSSDNSISDNNITNNSKIGIGLWDSSSNDVSSNKITNNYHGVWLASSLNNSIRRNNITNNVWYGIGLSSSGGNMITENDIMKNRGAGIWLMGSHENNIYHNNFINNIPQVYIYTPSLSIWDNGCEGNYWNDYNGSDTSTPPDGIGDTYLPWQGVDYYPLMNLYWNPTDINHDLKVDIKDVAIAAKAYGSYPGHPLWNPHADITGPEYLVPDGKVDIRDIALIAVNYGKVWTP